MNKLMDKFVDNGYKNFSHEIPKTLGMDTRKIKRSNTWVISTNDDCVLNDERFKVFDFTK